MAESACRFCGVLVKGRFCGNCGSLGLAQDGCVRCGHVPRSGSRFCSWCGISLQKAPPALAPLPNTKTSGHRAPLAGILGVLVPGAGLAWQGRLGAASLVLLGSPLLVPWVYGAYRAFRPLDPPQSSGLAAFAKLGLHLGLALNLALTLLLLIAIWRAK